MRKVKLMLTMIMATILFGGMGISSVNAVNATITTSTTNHAITLSRSVTDAVNNVTNTFNYTITADANNPSGATGVPTAGSVVFNNVAPTSGTATSTGTIELNGATFTTNGDYVYTVTETGSTNSTLYPVDSTHTYTIKVSVRNASETDFTSKVATVTVYSGTGGTATKLNTPTFPFTNSSVTKTITINKTVEGNMAETDVYFTVNVTIGGAPGDSYTISGQTGTGTDAGDASCTVATGASNCTAAIKLKHNETITISGIPTGVTYNFTETNANGADTYETYINGSATNSKSSAQLTVGDTNTNTIVNSKENLVPTGTVVKILPYVGIIALAVAAIIVVIVRNNKKKEELDVE